MRRLQSVLVSLLLVAPTLAGCSLVNAPDRSKLSPRDAGMDGDAGDADAGDAEPGDADPGDAGDAGPPPEDCSSAGDEDMDGLANCDDFDCSGEPSCCSGRDNLLDERWPETFALSWQKEPVGGGTRFPTVASGGGKLTNFPGATATGVLHRDCQPLALGAELETTFQAQGTCSETLADCEAAVVFTGANHIRANRGFLDDLAVRMDASGNLSVTQSGEVLAEMAFPALAPVDVVLTISPTVDSRGRAALSASVTARNAGLGTEHLPVLSDHIFIQQRLLRTDGTCAEVAGLGLAVEGLGDGVFVEPLKLDALGCQNPTVFSPLPGGVGPHSLDATTTGMGGYTDGGVGAPSLFRARSTPAEPWHVYAEVTSLDPELERFTHLSWAIGFSRTSTWSSDSWSPGGSGAGDFPFLGTAPPACLMMDGECSPTQPSFREPFAYWLENTTERQAVRLFFAYQPSPDEPYEIAQMLRNSPTDDSGTLVHVVRPGPDPAALDGGVGDGIHVDPSCEELRDPAVFRLPGLDAAWLLYTCRGNGITPSIHALPLRTTDFELASDAEPAVLLTPEALGSFAAAGVWGAEPIMDFTEDGVPLLRLWFMARSIGGATSVGLAQAPFKAPSGSEFPALEIFDANPVLRARSPALGTCGATCALSNLAVSRADDATLRFLVARRANESYSLVPLEQPWTHGSSR